MKFSANSHFLIGKDHLSQGKPCQDYALTGLLEDSGGAYAVISDGCSSGGRTEVGASLVSLIAAGIVQQGHHLNLTTFSSTTIGPQAFGEMLHVRVGDIGRLLPVERNDLLATCMIAVITPGQKYIKVFGDGIVALKYKTGSLVLHKYEWQDNTPYYPIYAHDTVDVFGNTHKNNPVPFSITTNCFPYTPDTTMNSYSGNPIEVGRRGAIIALSDIKELEYVALFSDGVTQVGNMYWTDVVQELLDFKNANGLFAVRRMNAFIKKAAKEDRFPHDDISMAVIRIEHEE